MFSTYKQRLIQFRIRFDAWYAAKLAGDDVELNEIWSDDWRLIWTLAIAAWGLVIAIAAGLWLLVDMLI